MTTHDMAGLTILDPIHILPLSSLSSAPFTTAHERDSSSLWDCELLKPSFIGPHAPSTSITSGPGDEPMSPTACNAHRRLMDILNLTSEPHANTVPLAQPIPSNAHKNSAIPAPPCFGVPPPPYAMHSPLTSTHKTPFSSYRLRGRPTPTGKSTMSFKLVAPVPRIPLASVLQYWASNESPKGQACGDDTSCKMNTDEWECEYEFPHSGLGLILGAGQGSQVRSYPKGHRHPYSYSYSSSHLHSPSHPRSQQSQSRSRYSRRLRHLAPAPLQLANTTPHHTLRTLIQGATSKRIPASAIFVDIPLNTCESAATPSNLDLVPDIESESQHSHRRASISSSMAFHGQSNAPTSLVFPTATEFASTHQHTNMNTPHTPTMQTQARSPPYVDLLSWRRTVSHALDSSPLRAPKSARCSMHTVPASFATSPLKSAMVAAEFEFSLGLVTTELPPPPLRRMELVPLPQLSDEVPRSLEARNHGNADGEEVNLPYRADLRLDLDVEDLALRAEKCAEAIGQASLSLRSCSLLKDPEAITELCESLGETFRSVQRAVDGTPTDFVVDGSEGKTNWYAKHWELIDSLNKNLNYFYLLAHHIEDRPPRIHRLAPLLDKLKMYHTKFADLARKISLSHEKLLLVNLRGQLNVTHGATPYDKGDRRGRREDRATRARQREVREEIRRVRRNIRTMREHHEAVAEHDENMALCDEDEDMDGGEDDKWKAR